MLLLYTSAIYLHHWFLFSCTRNFSLCDFQMPPCVFRLNFRATASRCLISFWHHVYEQGLCKVIIFWVHCPSITLIQNRLLPGSSRKALWIFMVAMFSIYSYFNEKWQHLWVSRLIPGPARLPVEVSLDTTPKPRTSSNMAAVKQQFPQVKNQLLLFLLFPPKLSARHLLQPAAPDIHHVFMMH